MKRITEIRLRNFRAFGEKEEVINLPNGENLLVYGENGSGKSSLYGALRDFLSSSDDDKLDYEFNSFLNPPQPIVPVSGFVRDKEGHVQLTFQDINDLKIAPAIYTFGPDLASQRTTSGIQFLQAAHKLQGFLTYKEVVGSYFVDLGSKRPNLYPFLVDSLLSHHILPNTGFTIAESWALIAAKLKSGPPAERQQLWNSDILQFTKNLGTLLTRIVTRAKDWLTRYFGPSLQWIDADLRIIRKGNSLRNYSALLEPRLTFYGQALPDYHSTLNEARLSALAVCLYLASLKEYPSSLEFKPLVLDDIFVGLDTNNRLPLLRLLNEEFASDGYQIVLTTYDREWFNLAGHWFKEADKKHPSDNWVQLEMYEADVPAAADGSPPRCAFRPQLVPTKDYASKAQDYFSAKDFPAAANYLRKELEELTGNLVPLDTGDRDPSNRGDKGNSLDDRLRRLKPHYDVCEPSELPKHITLDTLAEQIMLYKQVILNPLSHHNASLNIYREELHQSFNLLDLLRALPVVKRVNLLPSGSILYYFNQGADYSATYQLQAPLFVVLVAGNLPRFEKCTVKIVKWRRVTLTDVEYYKNTLGGKPGGKELEQEKIDAIRSKAVNLLDIPSRIMKFLSIPPADQVEIGRDFKIKSGISLSQLIKQWEDENRSRRQ